MTKNGRQNIRKKERMLRKKIDPRPITPKQPSIHWLQRNATKNSELMDLLVPQRPDCKIQKADYPYAYRAFARDVRELRDKVQLVHSCAQERYNTAQETLTYLEKLQGMGQFLLRAQLTQIRMRLKPVLDNTTQCLSHLEELLEDTHEFQQDYTEKQVHDHEGEFHSKYVPNGMACWKCGLPGRDFDTS
jgi:hypothetical protein